MLLTGCKTEDKNSYQNNEKYKSFEELLNDYGTIWTEMVNHNFDNYCSLFASFDYDDCKNTISGITNDYMDSLYLTYKNECGEDFKIRYKEIKEKIPYVDTEFNKLKIKTDKLESCDVLSVVFVFEGSKGKKEKNLSMQVCKIDGYYYFVN